MKKPPSSQNIGPSLASTRIVVTIGERQCRDATVLEGAVFGPFVGDSEMAERMRCYPWHETALGPVQDWSYGLKTALGLCLRSRLCSCIYWGEEHLVLCNDAYGSILGTKYPWALGRPAREVWPEIFDVIGPLLKETFEHGVTTGADDAPIFVNRSGYVEEFYCSFSYAPLFNESGRIEGVFATLPETSTRVIGERRLRTLRLLGATTREARRPEETLRIAAEVLAQNAFDIPFASMYIWDEDETVARLCAVANVEAGTPVSPLKLSTTDLSPLARLAAGSLERRIEKLAVSYELAPVPNGAWRIPPREILMLPLHSYGAGAPVAFVLAGVSPHKQLDADHFSFFEMVADHITRSMAEAFNHEQEDARLKALRAKARIAQQEERLRIARDLHDTLLQSLQGMRFLLEAGIDRSRVDEASATVLFKKALVASSQAIGEGREVLSLLRSSSAIEGDVNSALEGLGEIVKQQGQMEFLLAISGHQREFHQQAWNDIYAICREAVTNAARHSGGSLVRIDVCFSHDLEITVGDDGRGISKEFIAHGRAEHFGLQGMRERAADLGGALIITSCGTGGATVKLTVPGSLIYAD